MKTRSGGIVLVAFGLLAVCFSGQFPPFANPNELSRLETVYCFVEHGTFAIGRALPVLGDHEDKAIGKDGLYSNKAPGLSLAAIPIYRLLRIFLPAPTSASDTIFILLRLLVVSSVCSLALLRFRHCLAEGAPDFGWLVVAAAGFGTPYLYYARSFLSHAWTAALILLSWDLLRLAGEREARRRVNSLAFLSGLLAGWAAISEYPVALLGLLLAARAGGGRAFRRLLFFGLGAALPLLLLLAYDTMCFGSPLALSSSREALPQYAALSRRGFFGLGAPSLSVALAYLFHPARGVFLFSPFLLWAGVGMIRWWRSGVGRWEAGLALAGSGLFFLLLCGYPNWHGGWALGNRYLLPALFLAAAPIPLALASPSSRTLFTAAAAFSIAFHAVACASWPHFPLNVPWPAATGSVWYLARGWVAPGLFPSSVRMLLALAAPLAAATAALSESPRNRRRLTISFAAGIALLAASLALPPKLSYGGRLWRAAVFSRFSGRDPERTELKRVMAEASTESERRRAADAWKLYGN